MKTIHSIVGLLVIVGSLAAQLTPAQRVSDLTALASIYAKQYAPANWKIQALGANLFYISPWLEKARAARSDIEFLEICAQYVSTLQDGHTQFYAPGNFIADMGIVVDQYDDKVLIEEIDRFALPRSQYPFEKGDELVSVDGRPVADWIEQFSKLHTYANPRYTKRIAIDALTFRWQQEIAAAGLLGDEAAVQIRRASGTLETYKIEWQKSGTPITRLPTMPGFFGREPKRGREFDLSQNDGDTEIPLWQQIHDQRKNYAIAKKRDPLRQGEWTDPETGLKTDRRAHTGYGSNRPVWDFPAGFQLRIGRNRSDFITTGTYMAEGRTIGYLRFGQFNSVSASMFSQLDAEINYFNNNTDGLVVDVMRNPGGFGCTMVEMMRRLMGKQFTHFSAQERPLFSDVINYDNTISLLESLDAPESLLVLYREERSLIFGAWSNHRGLTGPIPGCYFDLPVSATANSYKKPLIVLVDDFSTSAADIFAAIMQDNLRGKLVGYRTAGAGGSVEDHKAGQFSEAETTNTKSLIMRAKEYEYPGFPKSFFIENVGVRPDIELDYQTKENLLNGGRPFVTAFTRIILDQIQ